MILKVTILILVEGSLQCELNLMEVIIMIRHNPYFSRRFFAILGLTRMNTFVRKRHNPYFSRRFFAIVVLCLIILKCKPVTILILVEGSLQYQREADYFFNERVTILILVEGSLQFLNNEFLENYI